MKIFKFDGKAIIIAVVLSILLISSAETYARGFDRGGHERGRVELRGRYFFHEGRWYHPGWFGINFVVNIPPVGGYVEVLPSGYSVVYVGRTRYYYYQDVYYEPYPPGYVVVEPPAAVPVVVQSPVSSYIVNIPNSDGTFTAVKLVKQDNGYVGPQGEYYSSHPTVEQLKVLYGK